MINFWHVEIFIKFLIVGSIAALALVVYSSSDALANSVAESSGRIEDEIRGLKNALNITDIQNSITEIRNFLQFIAENIEMKQYT